MIEWQNGQIVSADHLEQSEKQFMDVARTLPLMQYISENMFPDIIAFYDANAGINDSTGLTYEDMKRADRMLESMAQEAMKRTKDAQTDQKSSRFDAETNHLEEAAVNAEKVRQMMEKVKEAGKEASDKTLTK